MLLGEAGAGPAQGLSLGSSVGSFGSFVNRELVSPFLPFKSNEASLLLIVVFYYFRTQSTRSRSKAGPAGCVRVSHPTSAPRVVPSVFSAKGCQSFAAAVLQLKRTDSSNLKKKKRAA